MPGSIHTQLEIMLDTLDYHLMSTFEVAKIGIPFCPLCVIYVLVYINGKAKAFPIKVFNYFMVSDYYFTKK